MLPPIEPALRKVIYTTNSTRPDAEGLWAAADEAATDTLVKALVDGETDKIAEAITGRDRPLLLAISDNGPQMTSHTTREFLAGVAIVRQLGRPGVPQDQAWIETLFGHVKGEWPHLEKIRDGAELEAELDLVRTHYNTVRLSAAVGYVTPDDEHEGRGEAIRQVRRDGLTRARQERIECVERTRKPNHDHAPPLAGYFHLVPHQVRHTSTYRGASRVVHQRTASLRPPRG